MAVKIKDTKSMKIHEYNTITCPGCNGTGIEQQIDTYEEYICSRCGGWKIVRESATPIDAQRVRRYTSNIVIEDESGAKWAIVAYKVED